MKIALAQMKISPDMEENLQNSIKYIRKAASEGAELICFPEIQLSPFFPQYPGQGADEYVVKPDGRYVRAVCRALRENRIYGAPNFYVDENGKRYDMSFLIDDRGEIVGRQKMVHVAQCRQFYEQDYYTPSEEGFAVFTTRIGKIGIVVCFDRHYPESIRTEALRGADLIIIPTANTKAEPSDMFLWEIRVQAFQNSVNIAMCNRVGVEGGMEFSGESVVCGCRGEVIALAGDGEELLIASTDLCAAAEERAAKPYVSLRRREMYE